MKKKNIILMVTIFIVGIILCKPITCYAWTVDNTSVSNIVVRDGRFQSFDFHFVVPSLLAETDSWLGLQSVKFNDEDLKDDGTIYDKNYANINALRADDDFLFEYGIEQFSKESFPCFGNYNTINETLSDLSIKDDTNGVYYVYLWTLYNGSFYPDILLATVEFNNGTVRVIDSSENEMVNETFENLEAEVVEKIEINDVNFKLKVGDKPKFTGKIKNNSNSFDLVEIFMSLNRESTFASDDDNTNDEDALVKDFKYFHISEIYIKDNVNLKFDETTKVYINGVEQNKENIYVSPEKISISDENDVIIPEGYVAPAYLDEAFEEEQKTALETAILKAIEAGEVTYNNDEAKELVNEALENGGSIILDIYISESITKSLRNYYFDEETINAINNKIESNYKFAAYYDIMVGIYVNGWFAGYVTSTSTPLSITIPYPNGIPSLENGYQRIWKVIRYHEGKVDELDAEQTSNGISFENDKYSAFALVYEDIKVDEKVDKIGNPHTGDNIIVWICMLVISIISLQPMINNLKRKCNF